MLFQCFNNSTTSKFVTVRGTALLIASQRACIIATIPAIDVVPTTWHTPHKDIEKKDRKRISGCFFACDLNNFLEYMHFRRKYIKYDSPHATCAGNLLLYLYIPMVVIYQREKVKGKTKKLKQKGESGKFRLLVSPVLLTLQR